MDGEYRPQCPAHLLKACSKKTLPKGEVLILQGFRETWVYQLLHGRAQAFYLLEHGEKFNLIEILPGETIGETECFVRERSPNMVELTEESELLEMPQSVFLQWLREDSTFALYVMEILAYRLTDLSGKVVFQSPLTAAERCVLLLSVLCKKGVLRAEKDVVYDSIPVTRRSCNRAVKTLCEQGLIRVEGAYLVVANPEEVMKLGESYQNT